MGSRFDPAVVQPQGGSRIDWEWFVCWPPLSIEVYGPRIEWTKAPTREAAVAIWMRMASDGQAWPYYVARGWSVQAFPVPKFDPLSSVPYSGGA